VAEAGSSEDVEEQLEGERASRPIQTRSTMGQNGPCISWAVSFLAMEERQEFFLFFILFIKIFIKTIFHLKDLQN
jgi:hypothetical protein